MLQLLLIQETHQSFMEGLLQNSPWIELGVLTGMLGPSAGSCVPHNDRDTLDNPPPPLCD